MLQIGRIYFYLRGKGAWWIAHSGQGYGLKPFVQKEIFVFLSSLRVPRARGQCEDELRPTERLSETCLEQVQG